MTRAQPPAAAIVASGLRKAFGKQVVLDGIDLDVRRGTVFALLGPNGAGKTTTVRILATLSRADAGTARIAGHDVVDEAQQVRAAIGVTGQFSAVDTLLTGRENLRLMADLHHIARAAGHKRATELLDKFDLADAGDKVASTYSGGMLRRLDLAMTLVGDPQVVFLDEPTTGLDPRSRRDMWQTIRRLAASGVTILLTTQYLDEADELADRIAVLDGGRIVASGTSDELKRAIPGGHVRLRFADAEALAGAARVLDGSTADEDGLTLRAPTDGGVRAMRDLLDRLSAAGIEPDELSVHTPDLDDVFFALTANTSKEVAR
jgi:ABC-2 type transport system ATP-binding protein